MGVQSEKLELKSLSYQPACVFGFVRRRDTLGRISAIFTFFFFIKEAKNILHSIKVYPERINQDFQGLGRCTGLSKSSLSILPKAHFFCVLPPSLMLWQVQLYRLKNTLTSIQISCIDDKENPCCPISCTQTNHLSHFSHVMYTLLLRYNGLGDPALPQLVFKTMLEVCLREVWVQYTSYIIYCLNFYRCIIIFHAVDFPATVGSILD